MPSFNAEITAAIAAHKPEIAASFERIVRSQFDRIVAKLGPACKNVGNDWDFARIWTQTVCVFTKLDRIPGDLGGWNSPRSIDAERLAKGAAEYADHVAAEWLAKINEKLGDLDTAECPRFDGDRFVILGIRAGKDVRIEQDRIINVSSKGVVFHQYPARIYVDGKFTSAAKYKKAFAA